MATRALDADTKWFRDARIGGTGALERCRSCPASGILAGPERGCLHDLSTAGSAAEGRIGAQLPGERGCADVLPGEVFQSQGSLAVSGDSGRQLLVMLRACSHRSSGCLSSGYCRDTVDARPVTGPGVGNRCGRAR